MNCGYPQLKVKLGFTDVKIENYSITRPQTKGFKKYKAEKSAQKEERSRARVAFYNNLTRKRYKKGGKLGGKVFNFSRTIEDDISVSIGLVDKIYELGGKYSQHVEDCYYYVQPEGDATDRTRKAVKAGKNILSLAELSELLK